MKKLDFDKLTLDDVIKYLNGCAVVASRIGRSYDFVLYATIITLLKELKFRREKDEVIVSKKPDQRECALEVVREELDNGGPFAFEEWCRCSNCGFKHALFIPRNFCPNCGYKFTKTIYKGSGVLFGNKEDKNEQKIEGDARADSTCKGD